MFHFHRKFLFRATLLIYSRAAFKPFSERDEDSLVKIISTKPRHVLKHVRQLVWRSRKKELHFRNTVTQVMITLQDQLRQQRIDPVNASAIMDGVLEDCVKLQQHDMAHLLFRAFLRFRKYGCTLKIGALRCLFESYKGQENSELMVQLANEMKGDVSLRAFTTTALLFAGKLEEAETLRASIPLTEYSANDIVGLIEGYIRLGLKDKVNQLIERLPDSSLSPTELGEVFQCLFRQQNLTDDVAGAANTLKLAGKLKVRLDGHCFATILRLRMRHASSAAEVRTVEEELKQVGYQPDATGNSIMIAAYARLIHFGDKGSEEIMLAKVDTLLSSIATRLEQGDPDLDISSAHLRAVVRGYGAARRPDLLKAAWPRMQANGISNNTRVYNEVIKWYSLMGNVKDVLDMKEEMLKNNVTPNQITYSWIFRALGKWYPRHVSRFYDEMKRMHIRPDMPLYTALLGIFSDLQQLDNVAEILKEVLARDTDGTVQLHSNFFAVWLRHEINNPAKVEEVYKMAAARGFGLEPHISTTVLHAYSLIKDENTKVDDFLATIPTWNTSTYNVLLNYYSRRNNPDKVKEVLEKMRREQVDMNDVTFGTLITAFGRWKDTDKIHQIIEQVKMKEGTVSAKFYSILAATYHKVGDDVAVDDAWEDLISSKLLPDTEVYNQFLALYGKQHKFNKMQMVMQSMMKQVPPNPVTATTVLDLLGKSGRIAEMETLFTDMKASPEAQPTMVTYHQLMNAYAKAGDVVKLLKSRSEMNECGFPDNEVTFNILADGLGRAKRFEQLQETIAKRTELGIPLGELGYCVVISSYGKARLIDEVRKLASAVRSDPTVLKRKVIWTVIDAFCRCNDPQSMQEWVGELLRTSTDEGDILNDKMLLLSYFARLGQVDRVDEIVAELEAAKWDLSYSALNNVARGYARAGCFEKAVAILHRMRDRNLVPDAPTTMSLSTSFLKAGLQEQAQQIIQWRRQYSKAVNIDDGGHLPTV